MDEGYDVRGVEAKLASMEATRRAHTMAKKVQCHRPQDAVTSDFDLSVVDSSDSSDDEDLTTKPNARLRDSLDLSMSMSIVMLPEPVKQNVPVTTTKPKDRVEESEPQRQSSGEPRETSPNALPAHVNMTPSNSDDLFAGKLVQRRRELERRAQEQQPILLKPSRATTSAAPSSNTDMLQTSLLHPVAVKGALKPPGVVVSRVPVRVDVNLDDDHGPPRHTSKTVPESPPMKTADQVRTNAPEDRKAKKMEALAVTALREIVGNVKERKTEAIQQPTTKPLPVSMATTATETGTPMTGQQSNRAVLTRQLVFDNNTAPKAPLGDSLNSKKAVTPMTISSSPAQSSTTTIMTSVSSKPSGYARANAASNQVQLPPAPVVKKTSSPTKREPEDHSPEDIIDDLLVAEELRLRESLDKLSQRLNSLATGKRAPTAPKNDTPPSNQSDFKDKDEHKTVRLAPYGGGTHTRLHQPTSPTTRTSHARRSELSSGVHKARVRTGGVTALETLSSRADATADGKHKITVKRDLAHLLF